MAPAPGRTGRRGDRGRGHGPIDGGHRLSARLVSVVLPSANQASHIDRVARAYAAALRRLSTPFEIVMVVNASRDATLEECRRLAAEIPEIEVIESEPGWGRAVKAGLAAARGDILCYTNSARTQPEDLLLVVQFGLVNDQVLVKASRKLRESLLRRLGSVLYNFQARALFRLAVWDINGTPKVFPRSVYQRLPWREDGDLIDLEVVVACHQQRVRIVEVPLYVATRHGGGSTTNLVSALRIYSGTIRLWRNRHSGAAGHLAG